MQAYFHGEITREEAETRLVLAGSREGSYLVRAKDENQFALSVFSDNTCEHHLLQVSVSSLLRLPSLSFFHL
eukprot:m.653460 g.653460  ORF g.653460 m.653460 type:complete len:72 (+) comp58404_c0_seq3:165-380(+)